jgi:putative transposase
MARPPRLAPGGIAYHVMNRTWGNLVLFEDPADYEAFERVLAEAVDRPPGMRICAYCLMPNHFHLVLWPRADGQLSQFMQWLSMTHAQRWHAHRHTGGRGHLYQSRFQSFPIQEDGHFVSVCRYVERNPLRANLVAQAQDWRWSSLAVRRAGTEPMAVQLAPWPTGTPRAWLRRVQAPQDQKELAALRQSRNRGRPYGQADWTRAMARTLGIESSLRQPGRPPKNKNAITGVV